jgi:hypothetical protein
VSAAIFTARQAYLTNKQLRVARDTLAVTQDTARRQLRAYIFPRQLELTGLSPTTLATAHQEVRNAGQTPAYAASAIGGIAIRPYPIPENANFTITPSHNETVYAVINPGATIHGFLDADVIFNADAIDKIKDGLTFRVYVYGSITYKDAFLIDHHSNFCFSYFGVGPRLTNPEVCPKHNDAD